MQIEVKRTVFAKTYTIGEMYLDGVKVCDTIEDVDRGLKQTDTLDFIKKVKVYGKTAIPRGTYSVYITFSPKYKKNMPEIANVPGWSGVRIHSGNTAEDSLGCIIVGTATGRGYLTNSRNAYNALFVRLQTALADGELLTLTIN